MEDKFSQEILGKIKKEKITPKPKWHFLIKNYVVWAIGFLSLVIGGLAFSVIIYLMRYDDWSVYDKMGDSLAEFIFLSLPYFWLLMLVLFVLVVYYNIKHTKRGYRYSLPLVIGSSVVLSMFLGVLFFGLGFGAAIDDVLGERAPFYGHIFNPKFAFWDNPTEGRFSGMVVDQMAESEFVVLDIKGSVWLLDMSKVREPFIVKINKPITAIGQVVRENVFEASHVMEMGPGRGAFNRFKDPVKMPNDPKFINLKMREIETLEEK